MVGGDVSAKSSYETCNDLISHNIGDVRTYTYNATQHNSQVDHLRPIANSVSCFRPNGTLSTPPHLPSLYLPPFPRYSLDHHGSSVFPVIRILPSDACATSGLPIRTFA